MAKVCHAIIRGVVVGRYVAACVDVSHKCYPCGADERVYSGCRDGIVRSWDTRTGHAIRMFSDRRTATLSIWLPRLLIPAGIISILVEMFQFMSFPCV